ncbi:TPA: DUF2326 domain-containing protein [Enterococcus faecalis]|nr:DUF2326 domain-containing protein [Enterococcus faecalis]WBY27542.1 DUF2326 domain-containing protein [Enterococcus faecalis]HAP2766075.1 DUF2326 domain-containing protein [Enterococcus faecalis]HCJ0858708.1 DUF2326 domain-containing protein [Enterococcus faecalis]HCJ4774134.1 DUF2326 domain-containing protein [Enterococcus faecalis]
MFIKSLTIRESDNKEIRKVTFKKGMNIITDGADQEGEKGNSLGKTTVLRVIDICLGSKDKKYLYYDAELENTNTVLEKYICEKKVFAEMELCDDIDEPKIITTLKVELFPRGKRYINNQKFIQNDYYLELNKLIFKNELEKPTFRQLIGMFVRIGQKEDNNRFLKFIDYNIPSEIYENIYSFLFKLDDSARSEQILSLKNEIKAIENNIKQFKYFHSIKNENILKQQLLSLNADIERVSNSMSCLTDAEVYKDNEQKIQEVKFNYTGMLDELDVNEFKLSKLKNNLVKAESADSTQIDLNILQNLYSETEDNLGKLQKKFEELVEFNNSLVENKIDFYKKQVINYEKKVNEINKSIKEYFLENKDIIMLIESNQLEEYRELDHEKSRLIEEKGRLLEVKEKYEALLESLKNTRQLLEDIPETAKDIDEITQEFNVYFREYSEKIIQEKFILYPTGKTFPIGITNEETGLSTGTKKSAIAAFDLAYQNYAEDEGISVPKFIVHDVLESMDKVGLEGIVDIANEIGCQYIAAILSDKLVNIDSITSDDIRLVLTSDEKFFKV